MSVSIKRILFKTTSKAKLRTSILIEAVRVVQREKKELHYEKLFVSLKAARLNIICQIRLDFVDQSNASAFRTQIDRTKRNSLSAQITQTGQIWFLTNSKIAGP